jgi:pimeloyl-ACP methyl ester carboxylesterase
MLADARHSSVRVEGSDLHWSELGQGRPLVLLHGLCDSHRTWSCVAPLLARARRVLMPDLAGHGLSGRPDASYALEWHARVIGAWLRALCLDDLDLVGHSYGGGVAQWMLLEHRSYIRRLGLVAAGGLGREVGLALRLASIPHLVERLGQPFMAHGTRIALKAAGGAYAPDDIAELARINATPGTARAFARSVRDVIDWRGQRRHFLDRIHEIGDLPPIALFWGERDTVIPLAHAIEATSVIKDATLTRFTGCGHFPHRQDPKRFVRALEAFLDAPRAYRARVRDGEKVEQEGRRTANMIRRFQGAAVGANPPGR